MHMQVKEEKENVNQMQRKNQSRERLQKQCFLGWREVLSSTWRSIQIEKQSKEQNNKQQQQQQNMQKIKSTRKTKTNVKSKK